MDARLKGFCQTLLTCRHKFYNGCPWQRKEDHSAGFHERSRFQWGSWEIKARGVQTYLLGLGHRESKVFSSLGFVLNTKKHCGKHLRWICWCPTLLPDHEWPCGSSMGSLDVEPWQSSRLFRKLATCADARLSRQRPHLPSIGLLGSALHGRLEAIWWRPPRCLGKSWRLLCANAATWRATWIHHMRLHSSSFDR